MPSKVEVAAKFQALARGVARGLSAAQAGPDAGYGGESRPNEIARTPEFEALVAELKERLLWTGSFDPPPLIMELLETARKSAGLGGGAGMNAAARMYADIGRLTAHLASRPAGLDDDPLSDEEWLAIHGPET